MTTSTATTATTTTEVTEMTYNEIRAELKMYREMGYQVGSLNRKKAVLAEDLQVIRDMEAECIAAAADEPSDAEKEAIAAEVDAAIAADELPTEAIDILDAWEQHFAECPEFWNFFDVHFIIGYCRLMVHTVIRRVWTETKYDLAVLLTTAIAWVTVAAVFTYQAGQATAIATRRAVLIGWAADRVARRFYADAAIQWRAVQYGWADLKAAIATI